MNRECNFCKKEYNAEPRYLNRGQGLYCSMKCAGSHRTKISAEKPEPDPNLTCSNCKKQFYRLASRATEDKLRFCSITCLNSSGMVKRGPTSKRKKCIHCFKSLNNNNKNQTHKECHDFYKFCAWWNGNSEIATSKRCEPHVWVKRVITELRGDKCEQCGYDEKRNDGASIIQMDHIDGNCENNLKENLRLLCPNCHAKTDTYGSRNKGSGRAHRRKESLDKKKLSNQE